MKKLRLKNSITYYESNHLCYMEKIWESKKPGEILIYKCATNNFAEPLESIYFGFSTFLLQEFTKVDNSFPSLSAPDE